MIRDLLKALVREEVGVSRIKTDARLGIVSKALASGNVDVVVDGKIIRTRNPYRAVKGQEVALMPDDRGGFSSALPLRPPVPAAVFEKPPFFSGGVAFLRFVAPENRFAGGQTETTNGYFFQDAGSRKVYRLDTGIENTNFFPLQTIERFSRSGSEIAVALSNFGSGGSDDNEIRMYSIGSELTSAGDKGDDFFALEATLKRSVTRNAGVQLINPGDQRFDIVEAWTDGGDLFWIEETLEVDSISIPFTRNYKLYKLDDSGTTLLQTYSIATDSQDQTPDTPGNLFSVSTIWDASQSHVFGAVTTKNEGFPTFDTRRRYEITDGGNLESRQTVFPASVEDLFFGGSGFYLWHAVQTSSARGVIWTSGPSSLIVDDFRAFRQRGSDPIEELLFTNPVGEIGPVGRLTQSLLFGKEGGFLLQRIGTRIHKVKKVAISGSSMTASSSFEELSPDETDPENLRIIDAFLTIDAPVFILREV